MTGSPRQSSLFSMILSILIGPVYGLWSPLCLGHQLTRADTAWGYGCTVVLTFLDSGMTEP